MIKKSLIIFLLFLTNCGYQPIFVKKTSNEFVFKDIKLFGVKDINRKFISISGFNKDVEKYNYNTLEISSKKIIFETSKDAKGETSSYRMMIEINFIIEDKDNKIKSKLLSESFSYNNITNKFDLAEYQNEVENILIKRIFEELIIYLKL